MAAAVVAQLKKVLARQVTLPERTFFEFGGVAEAEAAAQRELWLYGAIALLAIGITVGMAFRRRVHVGMLLLNLPFSLLGSIIAMAITGIGLSIGRSEEHTSELQSLMRISYAVFCLKKKNRT